MQEHNAVTLPITDKEGKVEGLITTGDIAKSYMDAYDNTLLAQARTQYPEYRGYCGWTDHRG